MIIDWVIDNGVRLLGFGESDELNGSDAALVEQLEETMLSIGSRLSKVNDCGLVVDDLALGVDTFAVALHI